MFFVTLYKLKKKKKEKCSYIVFLKRCLVIRISRILYLTASGFFIFFFFPQWSALACLGGWCKGPMGACIVISKLCCLSWHFGGCLYVVGLIIIIAMLCGLGDLHFLTRDWTWSQQWKHWFVTARSAGNSRKRSHYWGWRRGWVTLLVTFCFHTQAATAPCLQPAQ